MIQSLDRRVRELLDVFEQQQLALQWRFWLEAAGEHVELTVCNARLIAAALHAWLEIPEPRAAELGAALAAWWEEKA